MNRRRFATGAGAALLAAPAAAQDAPTLDALWRRATDGSMPATGRADALLVWKDGATVFERYGRDHGPQTPHVSWSMAKSFNHALAGMAVKDGAIALDAPTRRAPALTLRHLLTMTDGLRWDENGYSVVTSDATRMLYGPGRMDGAAYTAAKPQAYPPGARWRYSTGAMQLASAVLQDALFPHATTPDARRAAMNGYISERLFKPLGLEAATAEFDPSGTFYGGSLVYASARDYAKFGRLYLQDGVWEGRRLLPEGWVKFARTPTRSPTYGAGFWLEAPADVTPPSLMAGRGPLDAFAAEGHSGQIILIVPSRRMVVVRLSNADDGPQTWRVLGDWMRQVVEAA